MRLQPVASVPRRPVATAARQRVCASVGGGSGGTHRSGAGPGRPGQTRCLTALPHVARGIAGLTVRYRSQVGPMHHAPAPARLATTEPPCRRNQQRGRGLNPAFGSGVCIRRLHPAFGSGVWIRRLDPAFGSGVWIRGLDPAFGSGVWIRRLDPAFGSGNSNGASGGSQRAPPSARRPGMCVHWQLGTGAPGCGCGGCGCRIRPCRIRGPRCAQAPRVEAGPRVYPAACHGS